MLNVSRQGFYDHLAGSSRPWKYESLVTAMKDIISEDECNDTYGRRRMYEALKLKKERNELDCDLPSEGTVLDTDSFFEFFNENYEEECEKANNEIGDYPDGHLMPLYIKYALRPENIGQLLTGLHG